MSKVIFHVPHDGTQQPAELMRSVCVSAGDFNYYQEIMRDTDVRKLIPHGYSAVCFSVSRLLCDVERFVDGTEVMEKLGMGFCYERVYDGTLIKNVNYTVRETTMKYYLAHHRLLNELATTAQEGLFVIDLHSFADEQVLSDSKNFQYADICLGYDDDYCQKEFVNAIAALCISSGYSVSINTPFCGSLVPNAAMQDRSIKCRSLMIEFNKRIYRPNGTTSDTAVKQLRQLVDKIASKARHYNIV